MVQQNESLHGILLFLVSSLWIMAGNAVSSELLPTSTPGYDLLPIPVPGYNLFHAIGPYFRVFERIDVDTEQNLDQEIVVRTHTLPNSTSLPRKFRHRESAGDTLHLFDTWLRNGESEIFLHNPWPQDFRGPYDLVLSFVSLRFLEEMCRPRIKCLFHTLLDGSSENEKYSFADQYTFNLDLCRDNTTVADWWTDNSSWSCTIFLLSNRKDINQHLPCGNEHTQPTIGNWKHEFVDQNLQTWLTGGIDMHNVFWRGRRDNETFAEAVGQQF